MYKTICILFLCLMCSNAFGDPPKYGTYGQNRSEGFYSNYILRSFNYTYSKPNVLGGQTIYGTRNSTYQVRPNIYGGYSRNSYNNNNRSGIKSKK